MRSNYLLDQENKTIIITTYRTNEAHSTLYQLKEKELFNPVDFTIATFSNIPGEVPLTISSQRKDISYHKILVNAGRIGGYLFELEADPWESTHDCEHCLPYTLQILELFQFPMNHYIKNVLEHEFYFERGMLTKKGSLSWNTLNGIFLLDD